MNSRTKSRSRHAHKPRRASAAERGVELIKFAYAACHDLNAPLRKIASFGDLLKIRLRGKLDATELDYLERMLDASSDARVIVSGLLTLAQAAHETFPLETVDMNAVLADVKTELAAEIAAAGARIEAGRLPALKGHSIPLRLILFNLLSNAVKFRRPGHPPLVRIDSRRNNETLEITVADNGIGFDSEYAEKIFLPFLRLNERSAYKGNGLGLAIGRAVAQRFGGSLTAQSEPGCGSIFTLHLPAAMLAC